MGLNDLIALGVNEIALLASRFTEQLLAGPDEHPAELAIEQPHPETKSWLNGWWLHAKQTPAHPGRIGGPIAPWSTVFHTTDMLPGTFAAILNRLQTEKGAGNAAHFYIGRCASEGVHQVAPITRNANHAGGPGHGSYRTAAKNFHPNLVAVGIEVHNAGGLRLVDKQWRWGERVNRIWTPIGPAFDPAEVEIDPIHPLRGWHRFTPWQLAALDQLLTDLEKVLAPMPAGAVAVSAPEKAPAWADVKSARIVGHCDLDAANRSDPWPPGMRWLRERAERIAGAPAATFEWRDKTRDA